MCMYVTLYIYISIHVNEKTYACMKRDVVRQGFKDKATWMEAKTVLAVQKEMEINTINREEENKIFVDLKNKVFLFNAHLCHE